MRFSSNIVLLFTITESNANTDSLRSTKSLTSKSIYKSSLLSVSIFSLNFSAFLRPYFFAKSSDTKASPFSNFVSPSKNTKFLSISLPTSFDANTSTRPSSSVSVGLAILSISIKPLAKALV